MSSSESSLHRLQERIAASRFLTFSLFLHLIIVLLAGSVVVIHRISPSPDFAPDSRTLITRTDDDPQSQAAQPIPQLPMNSGITPPSAPPTPRLEMIASAAREPNTAALPALQDSAVSRILDTVSQSPQNLVSRASINSAVPQVMAGRVGGMDQLKRALPKGGTKRSEDAVLSGLRWLKSHQNPDGSWSEEYRPAMTGLALLAFLGHGELPTTSEEFGPTVNKALDWVLARGLEFQGRMSLTRDGWGGNPGVYQHAILTYAMAEYFAMTKDERFEPLLRQAIDYIVEGQNPLGGWDYDYRKSPRNDLSVAGWQIQALKAAHLTGLNLRGVDDALERSMSFLKKWQGPEGGFGYDQPADRLSLTGVGVLCTYFWREKKDRMVQNGIDYLLAKTEVKYRSEKCDLYTWYYDGQACLMFGDSAWRKWNRMFQNELIDNQSPDGSWPATGGGVGELQKKPDGAGPFYRTTLCVLMLEVFYRYMPLNR